MNLRRMIAYVASLPERALRSTSAAVGGVSKLMTDTLLPKSVRNLTFYQYFIGNTQKFIIESLGQVESSEKKLPDDYLARKIVGNVVDAAGIFAVHFSPLWFFAIVSDAAGGAQAYLRKIVEELKKDGSLGPEADVRSVDELLEALSAASRTSTQPLDAPPLSKADLAQLKNEIASSYGELYRKSALALPSLDSLWNGLLEIRNRDKVQLVRLSGAMAMSATRAVGRASGALFYEKIVRSYADSIQDVRARGFGPYLADAARPYLDAIAGAFSTTRRTLTEKLLGGAGE